MKNERPHPVNPQGLLALAGQHKAIVSDHDEMDTHKLNQHQHQLWTPINYILALQTGFILALQTGFAVIAAMTIRQMHF